MSFFSRIFGWHKPEPAPFVPVYPDFCAGTERVVFETKTLPVSPAQDRDSTPARKNPYRTKPWNKRRVAQIIAAEVLSDMRAAGFDGPCTIVEVDEWITDHCETRDRDIGGLTHCAIRAAMKRCAGVRFECHRLRTDPAYESLRRRHRARKQTVPVRCWIFIVGREPEHVEATMQLDRRAA